MVFYISDEIKEFDTAFKISFDSDFNVGSSVIFGIESEILVLFFSFLVFYSISKNIIFLNAFRSITESSSFSSFEKDMIVHNDCDISNMVSIISFVISCIKSGSKKL